MCLANTDDYRHKNSISRHRPCSRAAVLATLQQVAVCEPACMYDVCAACLQVGYEGPAEIAFSPTLGVLTLHGLNAHLKAPSANLRSASLTLPEPSVPSHIKISCYCQHKQCGCKPHSMTCLMVDHMLQHTWLLAELSLGALAAYCDLHTGGMTAGQAETRS